MELKTTSLAWKKYDSRDHPVTQTISHK